MLNVHNEVVTLISSLTCQSSPVPMHGGMWGNNLYNQDTLNAADIIEVSQC